MIPKPATLRLSYVILTITLTVILISSPVITVLSPSLLSPIALKVEFASATSSSENNDDNEGEEGEEEDQPTTDVTTDGEEEGVDGNSGDVQQEGADGEQEQFATVVGEICDDFEDNDGDGLIDLVDVEDCAPPATQGTITAPTTPPPPPPSVTNTTATNSTNNTLTASEITTTRELTTPPSTDEEASGIPTEEGNTVTDADGRPVIDLEKECDSYEELGIPPPPLGFGQPPDAKWYHCPPGVGVWVAPNGTSSLDATGGQGGGGQQQPPPSVTTTTDTDYALYPEGTEVNDIDINCDSFEELGYEPPPPEPGEPPNLKWFDCDGVSISVVPTGSTTTTTPNSGTGTVGGGQQQQQQQPNSASACPPQPTNYHTAQDLIIHVQLPPSSPSSQTTTNPCPTGESSSSSTAATPPSPQSPPTNATSQGQQQPQQQATGTSPDSTDSSTTTFPGGPTITTTENKGTAPGVETRFPDDTHIDRTPEGIMSVRIPYRTSIPGEGASIPVLEHIVIDYSPKDGISIDLPPEYPTIPLDYIRGVFIGPDNTVRTWDKYDNTYTYYNPDGSSITQKADGTGRVIKFSNPNDAAITSHQGSVTIQYPDDGPTITTTKKKGTAPGVDIRFSGGIVIHKSSKGTVEVGIPQWGSVNKLSTLFSPDGTIAKIGMGDLNVLKPDNTASTKKPGGTETTYNPDGTVTTSPK